MTKTTQIEAATYAYVIFKSNINIAQLVFRA